MRRVEKILSSTLVLLVAFTVVVTATLRIDDFAVEIDVETSGELLVSEQINVRFLTPHHGIERFVPISGRTPWGETVKIDLRLEEVLMNGVPVPYTTRIRGSNRYLRIGDPDRTITGTYEYTIRYRVNRALLLTENTVRLYWNVTGTEWDIPIEQASAIVRFPDAVNLESVSSVSYFGYHRQCDSRSIGSPYRSRQSVLPIGNPISGRELDHRHFSAAPDDPHRSTIALTALVVVPRCQQICRFTPYHVDRHVRSAGKAGEGSPQARYRSGI